MSTTSAQTKSIVHNARKDTKVGRTRQRVQERTVRREVATEKEQNMSMGGRTAARQEMEKRKRKESKAKDKQQVVQQLHNTLTHSQPQRDVFGRLQPIQELFLQRS